MVNIIKNHLKSFTCVNNNYHRTHIRIKFYNFTHRSIDFKRDRVCWRLLTHMLWICIYFSSVLFVLYAFYYSNRALLIERNHIIYDFGRIKGVQNSRYAILHGKRQNSFFFANDLNSFIHSKYWCWPMPSCCVNDTWNLFQIHWKIQNLPLNAKMLSFHCIDELYTFFELNEKTCHCIHHLWPPYTHIHLRIQWLPVWSEWGKSIHSDWSRAHFFIFFVRTCASVYNSYNWVFTWILVNWAWVCSFVFCTSNATEGKTKQKREPSWFFFSTRIVNRYAHAQ